MPTYFPSFRVLVVEDDPLLGWALRETLVGSGHAVVEARDGAKGLQSRKDPILHAIQFAKKKEPCSNLQWCGDATGGQRVNRQPRRQHDKQQGDRGP